LTRITVHQATAFHALDRSTHAIIVGDGLTVPTESESRQMAVEMFFA
jgi:hypothetical protein